MDIRNAVDFMTGAVFAVYTQAPFQDASIRTTYQIIHNGFRYDVVDKETESSLEYLHTAKAVNAAPRIIEDRIMDDMRAAGLNVRKVVSSSDPLGGMWKHNAPLSQILVYVQPRAAAHFDGR